MQSMNPWLPSLDITEREPLVCDGELIREEYALVSGGSEDEWLRIEHKDNFDFEGRDLVHDLSDMA